MHLQHGELTGEILAAAVQVHRTLGPGYLEIIYGKAMRRELAARGIRFKHEHPVTVMYRGAEIHTHVIDLLVAETIVVELKSVQRILPIHYATVRSYLRAASLEHGLLINFDSIKIEAKRVSTLRTPQLVGSSLLGFLPKNPEDANEEPQGEL